jgi:hypothetical protein
VNDPAPPPRVAGTAPSPSDAMDVGRADALAEPKPLTALEPAAVARIELTRRPAPGRGPNAPEAVEAPRELEAALVERPTREAAPPTRTRKRRLASAPNKRLLTLLSVATLLALGAVAVLLDWVPNPFAAAPVASPAGHVEPKQAVPPSAVATPAPVARVEIGRDTAVPAAPKPQPPETVLVPPTSKSPAIAPVHAASMPPPSAPLASKSPVIGRAARAAIEDETGGAAVLAAARKQLADDDPRGAEALLRQALAKDPQDHHAMELLARALMDQDRGADALPYARKIVQRRPRRVPYRLLLGDLLLMVGDEAAARAEWEEARKLAPDDKQVKSRLGP